FHSTNYITANPNSPLSLHDALPISYPAASAAHRCSSKAGAALPALGAAGPGAAFGGATATGSGATRAAAADDRSRVFLLAPWKHISRAGEAPRACGDVCGLRGASRFFSLERCDDPRADCKWLRGRRP